MAWFSRAGLNFGKALRHMTNGQIVAPEIERVNAADVAKVVTLATTSKVVVVDVRDPQERAAGHIKGSINVPSAVFKSEDTSELDKVIKSQLGSAKEVVFHCYISKARGPACAQVLADRLKALGLTEAPQVKVLAGGVAAFMDSYKTDPNLVELPEGGWQPAQKH